MAHFSTIPEKSPINLMPVNATSLGSSSAMIDDDFEDACSICLESFCVNDPATVTSCKHEYHLHCILEWSQRSKECPICWQTLSLKDAASQELLAAVEFERNARQRRLSTGGPTYPLQYQESDSEYGSHWSDDPDFNERILQHMAAMMSRARHTHRNGRHRSSERSPSPVLMFPSHLSESSMHPNSPEDCSSAYGSSGGSSPTPSMSSVDAQPPLSPRPSLVNFSSGSASRVPHQPLRPLQSQSPDSNERPKSSEFLAFSDSIKSKLSAASAKYKDSISKGTQGFREKLLARNNSVKEMSKGVQREMSSSIAGVTRMIERLDLKSKRNTHSGEGVSRVEATNFFSKGKGVLDHIIATSRENRVPSDQAIDLHEKSQATCSISGRKDVTCAERAN